MRLFTRLGDRLLDRVLTSTSASAQGCYVDKTECRNDNLCGHNYSRWRCWRCPSNTYFCNKIDCC